MITVEVLPHDKNVVIIPTVDDLIKHCKKMIQLIGVAERAGIAEHSEWALLNGHLTILTVKPWKDYGVEQMAVYIGSRVIFADDVLNNGDLVRLNFFINDSIMRRL